MFFKTGPFSWNGIVGCWMPAVVFAVGMTINMWLTAPPRQLRSAIGDAAIRPRRAATTSHRRDWSPTKEDRCIR